MLYYRQHACISCMYYLLLLILKRCIFYYKTVYICGSLLLRHCQIAEVKLTAKTELTGPNVKRKVYIRKKADSDRIRKELQAFTENFDKACEGKSLNDKWDEFELTMRHIIDNCVPHKTTSSRHNLPRFTRSLRRQTRRKQSYTTKRRSQEMNPTGQSLENPNEKYIQT